MGTHTCPRCGADAEVVAVRRADPSCGAGRATGYGRYGLKKPSVYGNVKECFICHSPYVEIHHIWQSDRRVIADREGLTVPLCHFHHQDPRFGVHGDASLREFFRRDAQRRWEEREGIEEPDHETFTALVGENYL